MTINEDESHSSREEDIALFRYGLVREAADTSISKAKRGELVRKLAACEHVMLDGTIVKYSRPTIDRWIRAYRKGGFKALYPPKRVTYPSPTLPRFA